MTLQGLGIIRHGRASGRRGSQIRLFVLGLADVAFHLVLIDLGSLPVRRVGVGRRV